MSEPSTSDEIQQMYTRIVETLCDEDHPRYVCMLVQPSELDASILTQPFAVGDQTQQFSQISSNIFVTNATSHEQILGLGIAKALKHDRFILLEIKTGRYYGTYGEQTHSKLCPYH